MALFHADAFLGPILEDQELGAANLIDDGCLDARRLDHGGTDLHAFVPTNHENAVEFHRIASLHVQALYIDRLANLHTILLATGLYDCIHGVCPPKA